MTLKKFNWKKWTLLTIGWELLAFYYIIQNYIFSINANTSASFDWYRSITYRTTNNLFWVLLTPLMFLIAKKIKLDSGKLLKNIPIILSLGVLIALFQSFISLSTSIYFTWINGPKLMGYWERLSLASYGILGLAFEGLIIYCVFMAVLYGLDYYKKSKEQQYNLSQLEAKLAQAEVQAIKMQIHPHFLFNTLHAISTLMHRDPDAADKMITQLSNLLRISLDNIGVQEVTLEEELNFLEQYIEIQKMRFQGSLEIKMDVDSSSLNIMVPNLILQPIVENAFKHGVEQNSGDKRITISSKLKDKILILSVEDNGPGINENSLNEGLGLKNTRERLKQIYGDKSELIMENGTDGFLVKINIPLK